MKRKLIRIDSPAPHQGFLGPDHTARAIIQTDFTKSDPFVVLMDDILDKQNNEPIGGPHPHAGFETVTLLVEGEIGYGADTMKTGDLQMMTAGSGIVHTETIHKKAKVRILQLWLILPKAQRWVSPRVQDISSESVPVITKNGVTIKVYSGSLAGILSPVSNYTPLILADIRLEANTTTVQTIPASFTTFLYVLQGSIKVGDANEAITPNQVGWLDKFPEGSESEVVLTAGTSGARLVLYAGQPQGNEIVSGGPFIGDAKEDIARLYGEFRQGKMKHVDALPESQVMHY